MRLEGINRLQVNPWPGGGLEIEFNFQLTTIELRASEDDLCLYFQASAAPVIEAVYLKIPPFGVDLQETT